jgi:PAS domain S-box-containing protein
VTTVATRPLSVLLVEDSKYDAELVSVELRREGYDLALEHVDSLVALQAAVEQEWDLILCDYNLPGFGGMDALALAQSRQPETPFVILSGSIGEEAVVEALKGGARDCVLKTNLTRLAPVVQRVLDEAETRRGQRRAESNLRESEERLRLAIETAKIMIWDVDLRSGTVVCTGSGLGAPGLEPEDFTSYDVAMELVHPEDRERVSNALEQWLEGEDREELESRFVGRDGSVRWVANRGSVIRDENGRRVRMIGISHDITARKAAEEELRASNELLGALLDSSPLAIAATDLERRMTIWNAAAERMFGWRKEEVVGQRSPVIPSGAEMKLDNLFERLWAGEAIVDLETKRMRKDGTLLDVSVSLAPLRDHEGKLTGSVGVFSDVTDRKRARDELQRSLELLRAANEDRRRLLERLVRAQEEERQRIAADIHDDSVQALTALALRLGVASSQTSDAATATMLSDAELATQTAIERLRHLMFELRPPALDRDGLVEALRLYLDQTQAAHDLTYSLEARLANEPDPETRAILYRIAQEAIVNVAKHARATRIDVVLEERAGGIWVHVLDNGQGFAPDQSSLRIGHFGLDSMRERAELAGGWWRVESAAEKGTTVEFFLPTRNEEAA